MSGSLSSTFDDPTVLRHLPHPRCARGEVVHPPPGVYLDPHATIACTICPDDYDLEHDRVIQHVACGNDWHPECLTRWKIQSRPEPMRCPMCREPLRDTISVYADAVELNWQWKEYWFRWDWQQWDHQTRKHATPAQVLARPGRQAQASFRRALEACYDRWEAECLRLRDPAQRRHNYFTHRLQARVNAINYRRDRALAAIHERLAQGSQRDHTERIREIQDRARADRHACEAQYDRQLQDEWYPMHHAAVTATDGVFLAAQDRLRDELNRARAADPRRDEWEVDPPNLDLHYDPPIHS